MSQSAFNVLVWSVLILLAIVASIRRARRRANMTFEQRQMEDQTVELRRIRRKIR